MYVYMYMCMFVQYVHTYIGIYLIIIYIYIYCIYLYAQEGHTADVVARRAGHHLLGDMLKFLLQVCLL